ncbi:MAG: hypothetical protein LBJ19_02155, partial [Holosporaceae bacterium]|nr:hypothetical protein [Holosporaceae bacterium]
MQDFDCTAFSNSKEPTFILKRDGTKVPFDQEKIVSAIRKAGVETGEFTEADARHITFKVIKILKHRSDSNIPDIEQIQDLVEQVLINENYFKTARAYIVYRERRGELRRDRKNMVDVVLSINEYLDRLDWRVHANANQGYSLGGMILNISGKMMANYWLNKVYPEFVAAAHRNGDFHIHDLDMLSGYCAGWSLKTLLNEGFNGVAGKAEAKAPRHLTSA